MIISNIEDNHIQSLKLTDDIINNKQVVGSFLKNTGELSILNLNHTYDNLEHTYIDIKGFGKWYVDELKSDEEYISSTLKLNDITQKFDEDYQDTFSFPSTMKEWATWIGLQVGVPLKGDFLNSDIVLNERPYIGDNPSWRNAVQLIAKYSGGYAQKNYDNTYSIKWFDSTLTNIEDWENFVHGNKKPPINIIILSSGDTEDNVKYPQQTPDEPHELRIEDDWNYIDRYSINKNIYNQVVGFSYYPVSKLNVPYGLINLRAGQKIKTKDIEMNDIETYISKHTLEWQGGDYDDINSWTSSIEMTELKDTSTNYSYANSMLNKILKVERTTNKNTGDIRDLVQETAEQTEKIASLTTSLNGIEGKVSSIVDTTVSANGIGNITLKNVLTSELLYLQIYPTKEDLSYLNISPKTYLSNNTKLTSRDLLFLKDPKNVFNGKLENGSIDKDGQNGVSPELDTTTFIELKEKLNSINDVADEHDVISGKGIKRIGEYICTGDEDISFESNPDSNYIRARFPMDNVSKDRKRQPIISNYFKYALIIHDVGTGFISMGYFYFYLPKEYTTKEQYVQWLKDRYNEGNPLKIQYVLETPQEFTTDPVNIQLRKGYNKIEIKDKNGLLNKTKLSYLADTEKTVDGTNSIIIEDAEPVNVRSLIVYGNSFQETRSGKNLLNMPEKTHSYSGSQITMKQSEIVITGNTTGNSSFSYSSDKQNINLESGSNYTYSVYQDDNNKWDSGSFVFKLRLYFVDGTYEDIVLAQITRPGSKTISKSFTPNQDVVAIQFIGNTYAIQGLNTPATFKMQVELGDISTDYESYGAMPSPEFPSEIKCVEGNLQLVDTGKNMFDINNPLALNYGSGSSASAGTINSDGTITTSRNFSSSRAKGTPVELEKNTDYIISIFVNSIETDSNKQGRLELLAYNNDDSFNHIIRSSTFTKIGETVSISVNSEDCEKYAVHISGYYGLGYTGNLIYSQPMVRKADTNDEYEPYIPNKVRNTEKFAIEKSTYTIDLTGATDVYLFFYDENENLISKSGYHKLPYTFNVDAKYVGFMFKNVNNDNLNADDIKNLTIYDVNANEPAIRYTLPCNLYYINDEIKDELIIDYEKEQTFVIKRAGINAETGEKYALEKSETINYEYIGINIPEDGDYLLKMQSFDSAYINVKALLKTIYQNVTKLELSSSLKLTEESILAAVNKRITSIDGAVLELSSELKLTAEEISSKVSKGEIISTINQSAEAIKINADKIELTAGNVLDILANNEINLKSKNITIKSDNFNVDGKNFSWKATNSSMTNDGTLTAKNANITGTVTTTNGNIGGFNITANSLEADLNYTFPNIAESDLDKMKQYMEGKTTLTDSEFQKYDLNADGKISSADLLMGRLLILGNMPKNVTGKFKINTNDPRKTITMTSNTKWFNTTLGFLGGLSTSLGDFDTVNCNDLTCSSITCNSISMLININHFKLIWDDKNHYVEVLGLGKAWGIDIWDSDKRLKKNIEDNDYKALEKILAIKHRKFDYKTGGHIENGYIADELEEIDPDFVFEVGEDKTKQPKVNTLIPAITKAIQEQQEIINNLKEEIDILNKKINLLESKV